MSVFTTGSLEVRDSSDNLVLGVGDRHPQPILKGPDSDSLSLGSAVITGSIEVIPSAGSTISILTGSLDSTGVKIGFGTSTAFKPGVGLALFGDLGLSDTANAKSITLQAAAGGSFTMGSDGNNYGRFEYAEASNSVQVFTRAGGVTKTELMLKNNQVSVGKGSAASAGIDLEVAGDNKTVLIGDNANPPSGPAALFLGNEDTKIYHDDFMGGQLVLQSTSSIALVGDRTIGASEDAFAYLVARNEASVGIAEREDVNIQAPGGLQIDNNLCLTGTLDSFGSDQTRATFSHEGAPRVDIMRRDPSIFGNDELGVLNFFGSTDGGVTRAGGASIRAVASSGYTGVSKPTKLDFYISKTNSQALGMTLTADRDLQVGQKIKVGGNIIQNGSDENALVFDSGIDPRTDVQGKIKISGNEIQDSSGNPAITFDGSTIATVNSGISVKQFGTAALDGSVIKMSRQPTDESIGAGDVLSEIKTIGENASGQEPVGAVIEVTAVQDWDFSVANAEKCGASMAFWATQKDATIPTRALLINGDNPFALAITSSVKMEHLDRVSILDASATQTPQLHIHDTGTGFSNAARLSFTTGHGNDGGRIDGYGDDWQLEAFCEPLADAADAKFVFNYSNADGDGSNRDLLTVMPVGITGSTGIKIVQDMAEVDNLGRQAKPLNSAGAFAQNPSDYALFLQQERVDALGGVDPAIGIGFGTTGAHTGAAIVFRDTGDWSSGRLVFAVKKSTSQNQPPVNALEISGDGDGIYSEFIRLSTTSSPANVRVESGSGKIRRVSSDRRIKKDIEDLVTDLELVCQLSPRLFRDIEDTNPESLKTPGLIVDEVEGIIPELIDGVDLPAEEHKGIYYDRLAVYIVSALKEIKERLEALEG